MLFSLKRSLKKGYNGLKKLNSDWGVLLPYLITCDYVREVIVQTLRIVDVVRMIKRQFECVMQGRNIYDWKIHHT